MVTSPSPTSSASHARIVDQCVTAIARGTGSCPGRTTTCASKRRILIGEVDAEMSAAALLARRARTRRRGDAIRWSERREPLQPGPVADEAGVLPEGVPELARTHGIRSEARTAGERRPTAARRAQRARRGGRRRGIRAVSSTRAGSHRGLRCRRPRRRRRGLDLRAPVEVGDDAAHRVVRRRRDWDRLLSGS